MRDDISVFNGNDAMTFSCKVCKKQFASIPTKDVIRRTVAGTLQQEADRIVAEHLRTCQ
jgi:pantoate kinase